MNLSQGRTCTTSKLWLAAAKQDALSGDSSANRPGAAVGRGGSRGGITLSVQPIDADDDGKLRSQPFAYPEKKLLAVQMVMLSVPAKRRASQPANVQVQRLNNRSMLSTFFVMAPRKFPVAGRFPHGSKTVLWRPSSSRRWTFSSLGSPSHSIHPAG